MEVVDATLVIFLATIAFIIWGIIDRSLVALVGALLLGLTGMVSLDEAINFVDWDVMSILLGMWLLAEYMSGGGVSYVTIKWASEHSKDLLKFVFIVSVSAGFLSLFVDNVLIVILFGGIVARISSKAGIDPLFPVLLVALNANFMGTALLLGDLPPQLLHSVAGAEFTDFIWMEGLPSSFPLLTITYLILNFLLYKMMERKNIGAVKLDQSWIGDESNIRRSQLILSVVIFILTVFGMAFRKDISQILGFEVKLGEIALSGGVLVALLSEVLYLQGKSFERFEDVLKRIEWSALIFYASLFILVGGLEKSGYIEYIADKMAGYVTGHTSFESFTLLYWVTGISSSIIEHDALILSLLKVIKDLSTITGINPWPLYWAVAWGGTLGSNATMAGAPAIYVGVLIASRVSGKDYRGLKVLKLTILYALASLAIHYMISAPIWS